MPWTQFMDMHSGGPQKLAWPYIYIEAPEEEAKIIFYHRFGRNPERVTCTCCGDDYSISESPTLEEASAYERGLRYVEDERGSFFASERPADYRQGRYLEPGDVIPEGYSLGRFSFHKGDGQTLEQYLATERAHVIRASEIKTEERVGDVPEEGYVWQD